MFRPYIKQTKILVFIACINLFLVYISYKSYTFDPLENYDLKMETALIMSDALAHTKNLYVSLDLEANKLEIDEDDSTYDVFDSGLIGLRESIMTTKMGYLKFSKAVTPL